MKLFSTLAVQGPLQAGLLEAWTGVPVRPSFDPTSVLVERIASGERPDVLIAIESELHRPEFSELIAVEDAIPLVRTGIGLAVRAGAPAPSITTVDDLVAALTGARSVAYSRSGASGIRFARLLDELGIADQVTTRATVLRKGFTATALLDGRADLAVQQLSELRVIAGVDVIGPLPEAVQHYTTFAVAPGPRPEAAQLARFLAEEGNQAAYARFDLQPLPPIPPH
ncbi:substrate-binding domain-containing protein [Amycolatopsis magusensis]|uniref:substrate-binding domain-containing protein n=1 Tax=Amycolatopsis magusensis TaxID=882444 RepID=UPI0024A928E5|nr:substrate-binding domain-containing protein [Amycolatopsis magusensis]MDI5976752.1 substrate-binding domain-containing protein [Amycolatopsis magusensis]